MVVVTTPRHTYTVVDNPKMLRETLAAAQSTIAREFGGWSRTDEHVARLQRLIDECERQRPTGPDGKHHDRHTAECGCEDRPRRFRLLAWIRRPR